MPPSLATRCKEIAMPDRARLRRPEPATTWPAWTDADIWMLGPDPDDAAWAAMNLGDDGHCDEPVPDEVIDREADEALAQDQLDRGIRMF